MGDFGRPARGRLGVENYSETNVIRLNRILIDRDDMEELSIDAEADLGFVGGDHFATLDTEAMGLLQEMRDFIAKGHASTIRARNGGTLAMTISSELSRLTHQLTLAMAWLLLLKAVHNEEMRRDQLVIEGERLRSEMVSEWSQLVALPPQAPREIREFARRAHKLIENLIGLPVTA